MKALKAIVLGIFLACSSIVVGNAHAGVPATNVIILHYDGYVWTYYYIGDLLVKVTVAQE